MNAINAVLWLAKLLTTYSVVDSTNKMTTASFCFQSVYEEDLVKVFSTSRFILKQFDYLLSISMHNSWVGLHPRQLSNKRNLKLLT